MRINKKKYARVIKEVEDTAHILYNSGHEECWIVGSDNTPHRISVSYVNNYRIRTGITPQTFRTYTECLDYINSLM